MKVIVKKGRYVLGETEDHFGIWDIRAGEDPIADRHQSNTPGDRTSSLEGDPS